MTFTLVKPSAEYLGLYRDALERGWQPNTRRKNAASEELQEIKNDPEAFLTSRTNLEGKGVIVLPDGSTKPRLPDIECWGIEDGRFCGSIRLRWQPGTSKLPDYYPGHIGYTTVPWEEGKGYAKKALALMLPLAKAAGLDLVQLVTEAGNSGSQRVIWANGGRFKGMIFPRSQYAAASLLYEIDLNNVPLPSAKVVEEHFGTTQGFLYDPRTGAGSTATPPSPAPGK